MSKTLGYDSTAPGVPLRLITSHEIPSLGETEKEGEGQVLVKFLAAPINRVDLIALSGQYPVQPSYSIDGHAIPGFDGCGVVMDTTSGVLQKGDVVIPRDLGLGTWRTHAILPETALIRLPPATPALVGALLRSGAVVAWLLLNHITPLKPGDWIAVSAGTSCVAEILVQFAKSKGINTVLVIRDRDQNDMSAVRDMLHGLGATAVLSETELFSNPTLPGKVVLALDSVFGAVGQALADMLSPGGKYVLVGMLAGSGSSIIVDTKHLFYKQISFVPFRSSEVLKGLGHQKTEELFCHIASLFINGSIKLPELCLVSWTHDRQDSLEDLLKGAVEEARGNKVGYKKTVWLFP